MIRSVLMAAALAVALAGCGRKGFPDQPEGATYPNTYPYTPLPAESKAKKDSVDPVLNTNVGY